MKRQKEVKDLSTTRLREGDSVLSAAAGSTRASVVFFSNFGVAYTARVVDIPASTGYGEPIQKLFKLKDGERIVGALSLDPRAIGEIARRRRAPPRQTRPVHAIAVTSDGYALRFSLEPFVEPSTRSGRRYARAAQGAEVVSAAVTTGEEVVIAATADARALLTTANEVNFLSGPGRGVILIKVNFPDDRVIGALVSKGDRDLMTVETSRGAEQTISTAKYEVTGRGGKGRELLQRGQFVRVLPGRGGDSIGRRALSRVPFVLALLDSQLRQLRRDIRAGRRRLHRFVDVENPAVGADVERPARCEAQSAQNTVGGRNLFRRIREDRVVGLDVLGELPVLFRVIDAGREVSDVELPDGLAALTERLAFGRSTASERFRKPGEHDGALALEVGKSIGLAVRPWKVEGRSRIADLQFGSRLSAEAGEAGHEP